MPVRASVMTQIQAEATPAARARWEALSTVTRSGLLVPPKFAAYPAIEEHLWRTVQAAMTGVSDVVTGEGESMSSSMDSFANTAKGAFKSV